MDSTPTPPDAKQGEEATAASETKEAHEAEQAPEAQNDSAASEPDAQPPESRGPDFPVVGIGASAGGLEALGALTRKLTASGMAFVVLQHFAPGHESMLGEILARGTSVKVVTVEDRMRVEPGTIYVAPPDLDVTLDGATFRATRTLESRAPRHAIDVFLRSLAAAAGPMAIGVVLSGAGTDGTLGLKAIKNEGGITLVQEPSSAGHSSMPQSALDAGCADLALTPAEIGDELMRLSSVPWIGRERAPRAADREALSRIFTLLRNAFGIDFALYKHSTIERRIARRMALHRLDTTAAYAEALPGDPTELRNLHNDLLIGVTSFFRDAESFQALKAIVFPHVFATREPETPVRVWVAGCATGEEAYSVGIAMLEYLGNRGSTHRIQIFATDVDEDALARARSGVYPSNIEIDVSPERLRRFFVKHDRGYQVAQPVRDLIVFARHDLSKDPPFSRLDLVTCRNVLIYMQPSLQRKVLRILHYALSPESHLVLGASESAGEAADLFHIVDHKAKVFVKKNIPAAAAFDFGFGGRFARDDENVDASDERRPMANVAQIADRKVLERYAPPGVLVDDRLEVMQFRGRTGSFLEPQPGAATLSLMKLVRAELLVPLRTAVHKAMADGVTASSPAVPVWGDGGERRVSVDAIPLADTSGRKCLLVMFREETEKASTGAERATDGGAQQAGQAEGRALELERELSTTKEYLQSTIEELEATNEEIQSSNEELQSSNEELQSTNEELETSKEELQSTNEELATVNDELQNRMTQLSVANDDLQNVLANTSPALVIVGPDLRIRRFSASAEKLLSLIPGDAGRPVAYLRNVLSARDIEQIASDAMKTITPRDQRVRCTDGSWYSMRMQPYRTADDAIRGLVIEFARTTPPGTPGEDDELPALTRDVLSALAQPVMLLDRKLKLVWANGVFFETFGVAPAAFGRPVAEAWGSATEPPELWVFLEELVSGHAARDVVIAHPFGRTAERPMRLSGRVVVADGDRAALLVVTMQEV